MATDPSDRIEGLRTIQFPTERRGGYDRAAVDAYLTDLADWLDSDQAKGAIAKREIAQVGERTGAIITAAQEGAEKIVSEARAEVESGQAEAKREIAEQRAAADAYAAETRTSADTEAAQTRGDAAEHSKLTIREADDRLERAARQAEERTAGVENEIAELVVKRDKVVSNLEALVAAVRRALDGPGAENLELPERSRTAAAFVEQPIAHPEVVDAPPLAEAETSVEPAAPEREPEPEPVSEPEPEPDRGPEPEPEPDSEEAELDPAPQATRPYAPEFDTDEELYEDERPPDPIPSGRDPARRPAPDPGDDPPTDEKRTEIL